MRDTEMLAAPTRETQRCCQHAHARQSCESEAQGWRSESTEQKVTIPIQQGQSQRRDIGSAIKGNHCKAHRLCISCSLPFQNQSFFDLGRVLVESRDLPEQQTAQRQQERPTSPRCEPSSTHSLPLVREPTPMESVMRKTTMHPLTESVMRLRTESRV